MGRRNQESSGGWRVGWRGRIENSSPQFEQLEKPEDRAEATQDHHHHGFIGRGAVQRLIDLGGNRLGNIVAPEQKRASGRQHDHSLCFIVHALSSLTINKSRFSQVNGFRRKIKQNLKDATR